MFWTALVWAMFGLTSQGSQRFLDLTAEGPTVAGVDRYVEGSACAAGGHGRTQVTPALALSIDKLNDTQYSKGGKIVADLRLTNIGQQPVLVPWVREIEFGTGFQGPRAVQAAVGVYMTTAQGKDEHMLMGAILRGTLDRQGTTQTIGPGESVRIRLPGIIPVNDGPLNSIERLGGPDVQVAAVMIFSNAECETWKPVRSAPIQVRLRNAPQD